MRALDIKLWRDLTRLRAQVLTIGVVVACGVAGFVGMFSTHASLKESRDAYYRQSRFADVFASVKRAPLALRERLAAIDGVAEVRLTTAFDTQLDLPELDQPVIGRFIGLDLAHLPAMNALTLRRGRLPESGPVLEAVVNERFAEARALALGTTLAAVLNGRRQAVRIVGTVLSPEYVFASRGEAPDDAWFGVLWIDAERMATAFDMDGAFNRAALRLDAGAPVDGVLASVDRLLEPYGAIGAVARKDQISNAIVANELSQLEVIGTLLPAIFLVVAAFILNVVMSRQVATQRQQIATLKALGYRDRTIAAHYIALALAISAVGCALGLVLSTAIGEGMISLYVTSFRFASLEYRSVPWAIGAAVLLVAAAASLGAFAAIRSVLALSPAQAMQPPAPPSYRRTLLERLGLARHAGAAVLMVVRNLERRPLRALFTIFGAAAAVALQISGAFFGDAMAHIADVQYRLVQQGEILLSLNQPADPGIVSDLLRLPGVIEAEAWRSEPVRVHARGRRVDTVISGHPREPHLLRIVDEERGAVAMPDHGAVLSALLARELGVGPGDVVEVEFRLWHRRRVPVTVAEVAHVMFGKSLSMELGALNRLAGDGAGVGEAALRIDTSRAREVYAAIKAAPAIAAVFDKSGSLRTFRETSARNMGFFTSVMTAFAMAMAAGITYNAVRIALSERAWELASLRVLGMTRAEVSMLLLAELAVALVLALPLGCLFGNGLAHALMAGMQSSSIDFPVVITPATYGTAMLCVLAAALGSALVVRRSIDRLDLVAVLKVRE